MRIEGEEAHHGTVGRVLLGLGGAEMVPSRLKVASQLLAQWALGMRLQIKDVSGLSRGNGHLVKVAS